jgi:YidC/Oxa1 family membrane protein insertase
LAVFPPLDAQGQGNKFFSDVVDEIRFVSTDTDAKNMDPAIITYLYSPMLTVPANNAANPLALDYGIYAGPLDRHILTDDVRYSALSLKGLILYQISAMCAFCTFQWLAILLLNFLSLVDVIALDWGVAIILLVVVVRALLHPLTKKSQINMQRFGKQMQVLKPEIEKLQKKYGDDPKRMQQEQMRLWKENGVNPLQMLGCLPMFLQMPIWIALYAMLYLAFDLRQEPAFYGIFQQFTGGSWRFLADLSAADHFLGEFDTPRQFLLWNVTGINVLPLLMGVIFFIQQKYMSPPPSPTMTKEQINQQRIMKVMMVVMFPLMLYSAPSGLTLYILTSSTIGIIESKYVRAHINEMDLNPPKPKSKTPAKGPGGGKKKPKDAQGRAFHDAIERAKSKGKDKGKQNKFKRRK